MAERPWEESRLREFRLVQDQTPHGWAVSAASNIPANNLGRISAVGEKDVGNGLQLEYLVPSGVGYVGMQYAGDWSATMAAIRFRVSSRASEKGVFILEDARGTSFQARWETNAGRSQLVDLRVAPEVFSQSWGGPSGDAKIHFPIKKIAVGVSSMGPTRGVVTFSDFRFTTSHPVGARPATLSVLSNGPSSVFLPEEAKSLRIWVHNHLPNPGDYTLSVRAEPVFGVAGLDEETVRVEALSSVLIEYPIHATEPAYIAYTIALKSGEDAVDTKHHGVSVVADDAGAGAGRGDFFGLCFMYDMEAARRMGVRFVRELVHWKYFEVQPGAYYTREVDTLLENAVAKGLGVILTAVVRESPSWAGFSDPSGFLQGDNQMHLTQFLLKVAERMRLFGVNGAIEIQNEPDIALMWLHKIEVDRAAEIGAFLLRQGYRALKESHPDLPVLGVGMSGMDFDAGLPLTRRMFAQSDIEVDYVAAHPYTQHRFVVDGRKLEWPDSGYMRRHWKQMLTFAEAHAEGGAIWSTELGWAVEIGAPLLSRRSLDLAAILAQTMILSKATPGVEKLAWFGGQLEWLDEGYDYSIFRRDAGEWYPTPAVNAFAATARMLEGADFVRQIEGSPQLESWLLINSHTDRAIVALWAREEVVAITGNGDCTLTSFYAPDRSMSGTFTEEVSRAPVFFHVPTSRSEALVHMVEGLRVTTVEGEKTSQSLSQKR